MAWKNENITYFNFILIIPENILICVYEYMSVFFLLNIDYFSISIIEPSTELIKTVVLLIGINYEYNDKITLFAVGRIGMLLIRVIIIFLI